MCSSIANMNGFRIKMKDGKNTLTNNQNGNFTISELEIWQIKEYINEQNQYEEYFNKEAGIVN